MTESQQTDHSAKGTKEMRRALEYQARFSALLQRLYKAESLSEIMPDIEQDLLQMLNAERITVYQKAKNGREIISKYKSGTEITEIRVPLSPSSIAGYVAMSQSVISIKNAYDSDELCKIHPDLKFGRSFDVKSGFRTQTLLAVPIRHQQVLLGVLQLLNRRGGGAFSSAEVKLAEKMADLIAQKFRYELGGTNSPLEYLIQTNRLKKERLEELERRAQRESRSLYEMLLSDGGISRAELGESLSKYYQVPFMTYEAGVTIPRELIAGINDTFLIKQSWVPVSGDRNQVTILIDDPYDTQRVMEIQRIVGAKEYVFRVGLKDDILRFLGQNIAVPGNDVDLHDLVGKLQSEVDAVQDEIIDTVDENAATVIQLVNRLIQDAYEARASDIHIEPGKGRSNTSVRFRVDGVCRAHLSLQASHSQAVVSRIKIISGLDISERRKPQDGKCLVRFRGQPIELRVATIPTVNGESVVMRILGSSEPLDLARMNFSARNLEMVNKLLAKPHGILLVVGPTGSGKTTTLHSLIGCLNTPERKIWTAEDPVEITQPGLHQLQVQPKIGLTFAAALRAFLRADPDVIMIGEMRDQETAHAGIEASLTGHLVFSTLHTNSAPETIVRLLDLGIDPVNFSDALLGVLAQRLVPKLCENCKQAYTVDDEVFSSLKIHYGEEYFEELSIKAGQSEIYKAVGCEHCAGSGYKGRTGVHELLTASPAVKTAIYKNCSAHQLKTIAIAEGMRTLMQDGILKLLAGQTDLIQILKAAAV